MEGVMFGGLKQHKDGIAAALAISAGASGVGAASQESESPDNTTQRITEVAPETMPSLPALNGEEALPDLEKLNFSLNLSSQVVSRYTAIGRVLDDGPSLHSNARLTFPTEYGNLFLNIWNHTPLTSREGSFSEVDLNIGASKQLGDFELTLEHGSFFFPDSDIPTMHQLEGAVDWSNEILPLSAKLSFNHTTNDVRAQLSAYKPIRLSDEVSLIPSAHVGAALLANTLYDREGITDIGVGVRAEWQPKDSNMTLFGGVEYLHSFTHPDDSGLTFRFGLSWGF